MRGDEIVELKIVVPKVQDERSKEILRELARLNPEDPRAELAAHEVLGYPLRHLDAGAAQDADPFSVDAWVRIAHADHHAANPARHDDP